jgi:hypothetical protein
MIELAFTVQLALPQILERLRGGGELLAQSIHTVNIPDDYRRKVNGNVPPDTPTPQPTAFDVDKLHSHYS